jgi:Beta-propeller repeat
MPPGTPGPLAVRCVPFFILPPESNFGGDVRLNRLRQGTGLVWGRVIAAGLVLAVLAGIGLWAGSRASRTAAVFTAPAILTAGASPSAVAPSQVVKALGRLPLMFEPNVGQTDPQVKFLARGAGYGLFLTANEAVFSFTREVAKSEVEQTSVLRMRLNGAASHPSVTGGSPLPGKSNYFLGNDPSKWRQNVPQFARATYKNIYPGVDLAYYGNQGQLEYDFTVAPGSDPKVVRLDFSGAEKVALDSGDLNISTRNESVRLHAPRVYQMKGQTQEPVDAHFVMLAGNEVGFEVGNYDRTRALVIDPVLSYSTYLGGSGNESSPQIAVDSAFNFYLAGSTTSADFPKAGTPFQSALAGTANVFVAKFDSTGSTLEYGSYLGGNGTDTSAGVAVDAAGNIYIAGTTTSTNFPTSSSAYQTASKTGSGTHTFVTELTPNPGTGQVALPYSTYLSGSGTDTMSGLTIDSKGNIYVIGITTSNDFPVAPKQGAFQDTLLGPNAFFVSKLSPLGNNTGQNSLIYSTYFGGSFPTTGTVTGGGIAVDNNSVGSNIFITGGTNFQNNGNANDFPIKNAGQGCLDTPGQNNENGNCSQTVTALDAFVAKINPLNTSGAQLVYSTYIGGTGDDVAYGVQVDTAGNAYIAGSTTSTESPGVITQGFGSGPFQSTNKGNTDAFIAKITNPVAGGSTSNVVFSYFSYLGGTGTDVANALAIDTVQGAIVSGTTNSADLPVTSNAVQSAPGGGTDAFVARLDTTGFTPTSSGTIVSYLGGAGNDRGTGVAVDSNAVIYVAGDTMSPNFPTKAPFQGALNGSQDAFAAKLGPAVNLTVTPTSQGSTVINAGNQATFNYTIKNNGDTVAGVAFVDNLANSGVVANFVSATAAGGTCPTSPTNNSIICNIGVLNGGASTTVTIVLTPTTSGTLGNSGTVIVAGSTFTASASASLLVNSYTLAVAPATQTVAAGNPATFTPTLTPVGTNGTYSASISFGCPNGLPNGTSCTFSTTPVTLQNQSASSVTLTIDTTARTTTTAGLGHTGLPFAMWLPIGGLAIFGAGLGGTLSRKRRVVGGLLVLLVLTLIAMQPACSHSSSTTLSSGTPAGTYDVTVSATSGTYNQTQQIQLVVQ